MKKALLIKRFEERQSPLTQEEIDVRRYEMEQWKHICSFEGQTATKEDEKLFELLIQKKVSRSEFINICRY